MAAVHRKPLPMHQHQYQQAHAHAHPHPHHQTAKLHPQYSQEPLHTRTRTNSSSVMPYSVSPAYSMTTSSQHPSPQPMYNDTRRTMSNATSSTSSTTHNGNRASTYSTTSGVPRRSTSSRSNSSIPPTSYVALMRKQKATVWCDRAQHEDPRILVAQRQAKMRAAADIAGGGHTYASAPRTSTNTSMVGGVRSKIRHHGAPKASAYNAASLGGAGVPMRLSATEVDEGDSDEEARYQTKTGSGRNSIGSGRRGNTYTSSGMHGGKTGSTPPGGGSPVDSIGELPEDETPMPKNESSSKNDYFNRAGGNGGSGSSGEAEEKFGGLAGLPQSTVTAEEQVQQRKSNADDLRRRGSVDERTSTMSGVRLFIANPDFSD